MGIPGLSDFQELAWKIRASFELPWQMSEIHDIKNYYMAAPAPKCICQREFLPPPNPMFPCWDIWEGQLQKTVAYAQALHYWAEKPNPPMPGQPCLLVRCVLELQRMMEPYVTFSHDTILDGATLQEGSLEDQTGVTIPRNTQLASTKVPTKEEPAEKLAPTEVAAKEVAPTGEPLEGPTIPTATISEPTDEPITPQVQQEEQAMVEAPHSDFPGWTKVLHPPQLVTAAGKTPLTLSESKQRHHSWSAGGRRAWHQRVEEHQQALQAESDVMSPPGSPKPVEEIALPSGFKGVTACL